jgi:hypothetical protein
VTHTDVIDTLLNLSRPSADPARVATFEKLLVRVAVVQTQYANARSEYHALAERISEISMKAILPRVEPTAYPTAGKLFHAGTALLGHLDSPLVDLRDGVRNVRGALSADAARFTAAMQTLERDVIRAEGNVLHMVTLVRVIESALATLAAGDFLSPEFVVPPALPGFVAEGAKK